MAEKDEDFVTLAKAGGRKDLLVYDEFTKTSDHAHPIPYPWVEWFDHVRPPDRDTSPPPPHHPSTLLTWKVREEKQQRLRRHKPLPPIRQRTHTHPPPPLNPNRPGARTKQLPSITESNMKDLLSMDYQKEWVRRNDHRIAEEKRKIKEKKQQQEEKLTQHSMRARQVNGVDTASQGEGQKERFIMKRFMNVPAKLKLPPLSTVPTMSK